MARDKATDAVRLSNHVGVEDDGWVAGNGCFDAWQAFVVLWARR